MSCASGPVTGRSAHRPSTSAGSTTRIPSAAAAATTALDTATNKLLWDVVGEDPIEGLAVGSNLYVVRDKIEVLDTNTGKVVGHVP